MLSPYAKNDSPQQPALRLSSSTSSDGVSLLVFAKQKIQTFTGNSVTWNAWETLTPEPNVIQILVLVDDKA